MTEQSPSFDYADFSEKIVAFYRTVRPADLASMPHLADKTQFVGPARSVKDRPSGKSSADLSAVEVYVDLGAAIRVQDWRAAYVNYVILKRRMNA